MKLVGNWVLPDYETFPEVITRVENESWSCIEPIEKALKYVKKYDNAIDIGTWIGDSVKVIAEKFKNVYAFEARSDVYNCCVNNLQRQNITNVKLENYALSNTDGKKILLNGPSTFSGWINTRDDEPKHHFKAEVEARTLDSFNLQDIDFIKIDVDSHEGYLLQGSKKFFETNNPVIVMEHKLKTIKRQNTDMPDAVEFLESIGYKKVEQATKIDIIFVR